MRNRTTLVRVPKEIDDILKMKMPHSNSSSRWALVYDTSVIKLDNWLGQSIKNERKKR